MHPHTLTFAAPVTGVRFNAPWGPTSRRTPVKPCRVRRHITMDRARFAYWCRTGEIWRHKRPPIMGAANLLSGDAANFDGGTVGGWAPNVNCTIAATTDEFQAGTHSLEVTSVAAGAFSAFSPEVAVSVGTSYIGSAYVRSAVTGRGLSANLNWYTAAHALISTTTGVANADTTTGWTKVTVNAAAPATTAFARLVIAWGNSAIGEVHYADTCAIDTTTPGDIIGYLATGTYRAASIAVDGFDVTEALVSCWAGGGGGGLRSGIGGITPGAGGGGGAYAQSVLTLTPNTTYTVTVGRGGDGATDGFDSWFNTTATILARRGGGAVNNTPGAGGTVALSVGTTRFAGGNGGVGSAPTGGGGGGGAGNATTGNNGSGTTPGAAAAVGGGAGGAQNLSGNINGGGGGGAAAITGVPVQTARGTVTVDPTKFRVENNVVTEHVALLTRNIVVARSFDVITEHVLARTLNVAVAHSVIQEHVTAQGAKSIVKTGFGVITEHIPALTRQLNAFRTLSVITEHVPALTRTVALSRSFGVITEHVTSQQKVVGKSFTVIQEHVPSLTRSLVASRSFAVIQEHVLAQNKLVAKRSFDVITEHVTALTRTLGLQRSFPVITEHVIALGKVVTFDRKFFVVTEHVVTAAVCMDFDDVPTGGGGGTTVIKPIFVFDDF